MSATGAPDAIFAAKPENLSFLFQEVLTAIMRLRESRQPDRAGATSVSDARAFRAGMKEALKQADGEARRRGYSADTVRLAVFAVVAFVDESVLRQSGDVFADWARKPLQEELFGVALAGNIFFDNVQRLLVQPDSPELADLLELHQLCILLGYCGRYSAGAQNELRALTSTVNERIRRIRGSAGDLSPAWRLPGQEQLPVKADRWGRRLLFAFGGSVLVAVLLLLGFSLSLKSGVSTLRTLSSEARR